MRLIEELRRLYRQEPYRPLEFELSNGLRFPLPKRGMLLIDEEGISCGVMKRDGDRRSPDPVERGIVPYWFRGDQVVRVGYLGELGEAERRPAV